MRRLRQALASSIWVALTCALSSPVWAQQASGIAGVVTDSSGAILPGVTVEASSPALIEKVRSAVTDGEGRYKIVDLRPGTYTVTFTLAGFSTFRREGIVLTAGFTATVNAEMRVGALEETITVTGASPLVDTQNVQQQSGPVERAARSAADRREGHLNRSSKLVPGMKPGGADVGGAGGLYIVERLHAGTPIMGRARHEAHLRRHADEQPDRHGRQYQLRHELATVRRPPWKPAGVSAESDATASG